MYTPNYADYTLEQLLECQQRVDGSKYPERKASIDREIVLRRDAGELDLNPAFEEFVASGVPLPVAAAVWWCFFWRFVVALALCVVLFTIVIWGFTVVLSPSSTTLTLCGLVYYGCSVPALGVFVMRQALAKKYQGYKIFLRNLSVDDM